MGICAYFLGLFLGSLFLTNGLAPGPENLSMVSITGPLWYGLKATLILLSLPAVTVVVFQYGTKRLKFKPPNADGLNEDLLNKDSLISFRRPGGSNWGERPGGASVNTAPLSPDLEMLSQYSETISPGSRKMPPGSDTISPGSDVQPNTGFRPSVKTAAALFFAGWTVQWLCLVFQATPLLGFIGEDVTLRGVICAEPQIYSGRASYHISVNAGPRADTGDLPTETGATSTSGTELSTSTGNRLDTLEQDENPNLVPMSGKVLVQVNSPKQTWRYGDLVEFSGKLDFPKPAQNPGQFNYRRYLANRGIYLVLSPWPGESGRRIARNQGSSIKAAALAIRNRLAYTGTKLFPGQEGQLLNGMVLGASGDLDPELRQTFNTSGLSHILSVSGFHVALVAALPLLLGRYWAWPSKLTFSVVLGTTVFYALICGFNPPVLRSTVMIILGMYALCFKQHKHWPTILSIAAFISTFPHPQVITEPSFQLTFAATWAILAISGPIKTALAGIPHVPTPAWLRTMLAVPLAAQLGTWPLVAYHFNQVSLISILANLLLVDLAGLLLIAGIFALFSGTISAFLGALWQPGLGLMLSIFIRLTQFFASLPGASFNTVSPPLPMIIGYYGVLWLVGNPSRLADLTFRCRTLLFHHPQLEPLLRRAAPALAITALAGLLFTLWPGRAPLQVTFLDVGEGDAIFVKTPSGQNLLIDTGPVRFDKTGAVTYDSGAKVVLPYLRSQGINYLDLLILTHQHTDHTGGAASILENLAVGQILISPQVSEEATFSQILKTAKSKGIPVLQGRAGQILRLGKHPEQDLSLKILSPGPATVQAQAGDTQSLLNNQSLVIKLTYRKHSFLFTGDAEAPVLGALAAGNSRTAQVPQTAVPATIPVPTVPIKQSRSLTQAVPLRANILKLPHHGSSTGLCPEFYQQVNPQLVIVPVGPNYFGHPNPQVLTYFRKTGIPLLRTDHWGAITLQSDGQTLVVATYAADATELKEQLRNGYQCSRK